MSMGDTLVTKIHQGEIFELAQQGNVQAIMVVLNRHLLPKGAHIKVKPKGDCLQILLQTPRMTEKNTLLQLVRERLLDLHPPSFKRVKIYCPQPGTQTARLIHDFDLPASAPTVTPDLQACSQRYSIAEFLAHMTHIDDLKLLRNHPFFTGRCPQCSHAFTQLNPPPVYWDCDQCGWVDNVDQVVPCPQDPPESQKTLVAIKRLGNYLIEAGLLTPDQLEVALADQKITGMRLGEILVHRGWVKETTIEYLMEKVVLPERSPYQDQSASFLAFSRKLAQALMNAPLPHSPAQQPSPHPSVVPAAPSAKPVATTKPPPSPPTIPEVINERATLVLPDVDLNEYLEEYQPDSGPSQV